MESPKSQNMLENQLQMSPSPEWEVSTRIPSLIKTPGLFCMMDLPTEIRLQILEHLLVLAEESITIDSTQNRACIKSKEPNLSRPSVSILQTCKRINDEGTSLLYSQHIFTIYLRRPITTLISARLTTAARDAHTHNSAYFLSPMRWSTIACITTMHFTANATPPSQFCGFPQVVFSCAAADLLSRYSFTASNFMAAWHWPSDNIVLSMGNYISMKLMRAELSSFQTELQMMMRPGEEYLAALGEDPAA